MRKNIEVLHLTSGSSWRGGEQQIAYLIEELQQMGVVSVVACRANSAFQTYCVQKNIQYLPLPFKNIIDFYTVKQIIGFARISSADLVHIHTGISHSLAVWAHILGLKTPLIVTRRVDSPIRKSPLTLFKYRHRGIEAISCVSGKIREIVDATVKRPERSLVIHSGIDPAKHALRSADFSSIRSLLKLSHSAILIGNISALADHKDYPTFLRTAKNLIHEHRLQNTFFLIVGEGEEQAAIEQGIKDYALEKHVFMLGFREDAPAILAQLNLFLFTSKTEGLGTTVLDAFAAKVPVVATQAGGVPEMVIHEKTGLLAPVGDDKCLAAYVVRVLNNRELATEISENAYVQLLQGFTKQVMAQKNYELYRKVLRLE